MFEQGKMVKGEGLVMQEERMKALNAEENEVYKILGCEQAGKLACYMTMSNSRRWIEVGCRREQENEYCSVKREAEDALREVM